MNALIAKDCKGKEVKVGDYLVDTIGDLSGRVEHVDGCKVQLFGQDEWVRSEEFEIESED